MSEDIKKELEEEMATKEATTEEAAVEDADNVVNEATEDNADEDVEAASEEATEEANSEENKGKAKKIFGKKNKKDPKDEKIEELTDRVKRQLAEFENFRNRTEKEKSTMYEMGAKAVVEKILPVIDNFERGLAGVPEGSEDAFANGMQMIYKQLLTELDNIGVKPIDAVGKEFDPNIHNAVMQVASDEYESGIVAQELQKGYMYRDTLVRPSMVSVVE